MAESLSVFHDVFNAGEAEPDEAYDAHARAAFEALFADFHAFQRHTAQLLGHGEIDAATKAQARAEYLELVDQTMNQMLAMLDQWRPAPRQTKQPN